jgi:hypothetical protein
MVGRVSIAIRYRLDGPRIESRWGEVLRTRADQARGPSSPLYVYDGYRLFPGELNDRGVVLTIHPHRAPRLKQERNSTSTPPLGLHGLCYGECYCLGVNTFDITKVVL